MKLWILLGVFITSIPLASAQTCKPMNDAEFLQIASLKEQTPLIFFSSWCFDCKRSLEQASIGNIAIAVFDTPSKAQEAFDVTKSPAQCIFDRDGSIAKHFKIKSLPARRVYKGSVK